MPKSANETCSTFSLIIFVIFMLSGISPFTTSEQIIDDIKLQDDVVISDLQQGANIGKKYLINDPTNITYSASSLLKKQWIEDGYPGINHQNNIPFCLLYTSPSPRDRG